MIDKLSRRAATGAIAAVGLAASAWGPAFAEDKIQLRLAASGSETDQRSIAMAEVFGPAVAEFASYEPSYNSTLFAQGTELEAISRGNLEMSITSAQELAQFFPEFSIFTAGYVHQDAAHQVAVFNDPLMDPFKQQSEDELGVKLLSVMYLGRRQVNIRQTKDELTVTTPADLAGVNLRMPGTDAWQFLGTALGASPTPMAFAEVYTALSTARSTSPAPAAGMWVRVWPVVDRRRGGWPRPRRGQLAGDLHRHGVGEGGLFDGGGVVHLKLPPVAPRRG